MELSALSKQTNISERSLRRAIEGIAKRGGLLTLENNQVGGPEKNCFLATLYDLMVNYEAERRPAIADHFFAVRSRSEDTWVIPQTWPKTEARKPQPPQPQSAPISRPTTKPPAPVVTEETAAEMRRLTGQVQSLESRLTNLENRIAAMEQRFAKVDKALNHIELVLEDEDADNNLYNILINHIGGFNARLTKAEENWTQLSGIMAGAIVKFADDSREVRNLLRDLLNHLSPK